MAKFSIVLPDSFTVAMRNGASVTVDTAALVEAVGPELFAYGVGQKLRDGASGAAKAAEAEGSKGVQAEAQAMLDSTKAALLAGEWSQRGEGGASVDPRLATQRSVTRAAMKNVWGKDSAEWAEFTGLSDADQIAKLDENYADNESVLSGPVADKLAEKAAAKAAKKAIAKAVTFKL
jgi:hypothetical protein